MKRVAISISQFKISRPGYDVDAATPLQLAFDGFAGKYNGVYMSGVVAYDSGWDYETVTTYGTSGGILTGFSPIDRATKSIGFGKTFAQPPQVITAVRPIGASLSDGATYGYSAASPRTHCVGAVTGVDHLLLYIIRSSFGTTPAPLTFEISYVVFQS